MSASIECQTSQWKFGKVIGTFFVSLFLRLPRSSVKSFIHLKCTHFNHFYGQTFIEKSNSTEKIINKQNPKVEQVKANQNENKSEFGAPDLSCQKSNRVHSRKWMDDK